MHPSSPDTQVMIQTCQLRSSGIAMHWLPALPSFQMSPSFLYFFLLRGKSKQNKTLDSIPKLIVKIYKYLPLQSISLHFFQDLAPSTTPWSLIFSFFLSLLPSFPYPSHVFNSHTRYTAAPKPYLHDNHTAPPPTYHTKQQSMHTTLSLIPSSVSSP